MDKKTVGANVPANLIADAALNKEQGSASGFEAVRRFWQSPYVERPLFFYDLESSLAHVKMLAKTGIIGDDVSESVVKGLQSLQELVSSSDLSALNQLIGEEDIDIHVAIERKLEEMIGENAHVLRIAKSRNDQIATDIRLWLRDCLKEIFDKLIRLRSVLQQLAERDLEKVMPGYTHMQPAMPILLSHWWLANEARFARDSARLVELFKRVNVLPLGACALAGTDQPIDRLYVAQLLGFDGVIENSLDAISDRDYFIEFGSFASLVGMHISQLSSELLLWATQEFGFVKLPRAFDFASQSMPQKRNPEFLEILRAKPAQIVGMLTSVLIQLKGLPISYSQDLQECFPNLLDINEKVQFILDLSITLLPALSFDELRMQELANVDLTNTGNVLDYLTDRDIPHEKASAVCEALVVYCKDRHKQLTDLELNEWQQFSPAFDVEIYKYIAIVESVDSRSSFGGTAQAQVEQALKRASDNLAADRESLPIALSQRSASAFKDSRSTRRN